MIMIKLTFPMQLLPVLGSLEALGGVQELVQLRLLLFQLAQHSLGNEDVGQFY